MTPAKLQAEIQSLEQQRAQLYRHDGQPKEIRRIEDAITDLQWQLEHHHTATTFDQALQLQRQQRDDFIQQLQKYPRYAGPRMKRLLKKTNIGVLESLLRKE